MQVSRREFLHRAAAAGGAATVGWRGLAGVAASAVTAAPPTPRLPSPAQSGIEHIVVLLMENRSFDHLLGWVPGADGRQAGLAFRDADGHRHRTHHLDEWQGCGFNDPDHSYEGGRTQLNGGRLDGFRRGSNDDFALGYYVESDLPTSSALARGFTVCDRWFCSILGPTYPNRLYTHAAATDRITNTASVSALPTIWDRLSAAGVSATYYFSDLPVLALWGDKYLAHARPVADFFADAALGTLARYTYVDPFFLGEDQGGSNDDHPHADIRRGQALISAVVRALTESPLWPKTVLVVTYDEWGGFFEHVRPPRLPDAFRPTPHEEHNTAGFRVPAYIVSPFAPRGRVAHGQYDHTSILKMVEWRFGLRPLTPRDAAARNVAEVLDFSAPNLHPADVPFAPDPGPHVCTPGATGGMAAAEPMWLELAASPLLRGWRSLV
jgi:phospholipase C